MADQVAVTKVIEVDVKASAAAAAHIKSLADSMDPIKKNAQEATNSLGSMLNMVRGFVGFQILDMVGGKVIDFARSLQEASDKSKILEERMKLVTGSSTEAGNAFQQVIEISIRQGRELDSVAKLYEKVQRNSEQLALTQKGVAIITEGVAASLRLSGASTQESSAAMLQFAQALASGKLGGDEFRSLMENNSVLMQNFAKELNTTMGGLREMSKEGKLNAETLREAMLKVGEDGKNMMQRMIEQAQKLPQSFTQAVEGAKTALVDLTNALQQTGDKGEGVFTRMVKAITQSIREAAQRLRDYALINEEVAKQLEKKMGPKEGEIPFESRYAMENLERKRLAEEALARAERGYALARAANREVKDWDKSVLGQKWIENIARAKGELLGVEKIMARIAAEDAGDIMGGGFTTGKVPKDPNAKPDTKKPKAAPTTDKEVLEDIREELEREAELNTQRLMGIAVATDKAQTLIDRLNKAKDGLSKAEREYWEGWIRRQVAQNEQDQREIEAREFFQKAVQSSDEREIARYNRDIDAIRDQANRDRLTQDPFIGAEAEVERLKAIMWDERTSDEMAQIIADRIGQVRAKAAKQLLGEKDPLKTIPEQMADNWSIAFSNMEEDLLDFSISAKDIVFNLVESILRDFARLQMREALQPLMEGGRGWMKDVITNIGQWVMSADGTAWNNGVRFMSKGGLLDRPTMMQSSSGPVVGGEMGTEAIMPLKRGSDGTLGVGATPVTVNVFNNANGTRARTEHTTTPSGEQQINVIVEEMVESSLGSGRFDNVLNKSFALQRRGS